MSAGTLSPDPVSTEHHLATLPRNDHDGTDRATSPRFRAPRILAILTLAVLPFWLIPLAHVASDPETATGFFHYELPYYVANGRAAFERGSGVFYPNPYNPAGEAPKIYAHWLPWSIGVLTAVAGFDPGDVILILTIIASLGFAWATRQLVAVRMQQSDGISFAFLLSMWGGGLLALAGTLAAVTAPGSWLESVLSYDPGRGLWFLNWGS